MPMPSLPCNIIMPFLPCNMPCLPCSMPCLQCQCHACPAICHACNANAMPALQYAMPALQYALPCNMLCLQCQCHACPAICHACSGNMPCLPCNMPCLPCNMPCLPCNMPCLPCNMPCLPCNMPFLPCKNACLPCKYACPANIPKCSRGNGLVCEGLGGFARFWALEFRFRVRKGQNIEPKRLQKQPPCPATACPARPFNNLAMAQWRSTCVRSHPGEVRGLNPRGCRLASHGTRRLNKSVYKGSDQYGFNKGFIKLHKA